MEMTDILADYVSDDGGHVRIIARMKTKTGKVDGPDGLEHNGHYHASMIDVVADGKLVESLPLQTDLSHFSRRDTNELLGEIRAMRDNHADADEVVDELHSLLG
jgi:hypothetical protein